MATVMTNFIVIYAVMVDDAKDCGARIRRHDIASAAVCYCVWREEDRSLILLVLRSLF